MLAVVWDVWNDVDDDGDVDGGGILRLRSTNVDMAAVGDEGDKMLLLLLLLGLLLLMVLLAWYWVGVEGAVETRGGSATVKPLLPLLLAIQAEAGRNLRV